MVARASTDTAQYAPDGIPSRPERRLTLDLDVQPCTRPRTRAEPEDEETADYHPGRYVESGCCVTVKVEMAASLPSESQAALAEAAPVAVQRIVTLVHYKDSRTLEAILGAVEAVNSESGVTSAGRWASYKEGKREDLDVITGVQLIDGPTRLFVLEGHPAAFKADGRPENGMATLSILLERVAPNTKTSFTLSDRRLLFPGRCYGSFELPTKLFKIRLPLPELIVRPEIYQHLRVADACRDAVLALAKLLASPTLRLAHKHLAFPAAHHFLELEKKFGAAVTIQDIEGVPLGAGDAASVYSSARGSSIAGKSAVGSEGEGRPERLKAATDSSNPLYLQALAERATREKTDFLRRNIESLPKPVERRPLPDFYLASLEAVRQHTGGRPLGTYSGQRLNPTEVQKAVLQTRLREMGTRTAGKDGVHYTYAANYLNAESMGEAEVRPPPPRAQKPWDSTRRRATMHDGSRSQFEIAQPSAARCEDLRVAWGLEQHEADARAAERHRASEALASAKVSSRHRPALETSPHPSPVATRKGRWDALPSNERYFEAAYPGSSVFQLTEEQVLAEGRERKEGSIRAWSDKLTVDDPIFRVRLKSSDKVAQQERYLGALYDEPKKATLKSMYTGPYALTGGGNVPVEPSAFMHESTVEGIQAFENSLRESRPEMWSSTRKLGVTESVASTIAARSRSHKTIRSLDFQPA